jgi:hypothetical protein
VILAEKGKVLQGMIDRMIEIKKCCGMAKNVDETKAMRI